MVTTWTKLEYSQSAVKNAGKALRKSTTKAERDAALIVINNFRSAHAMPLNAIIMNVRRHSRTLDPNADVVQRLKRLPSIEAKLHRQPTMALNKMQDVGGCRAIVTSMSAVELLVRRLVQSRQRHQLIEHSVQDYVTNPKRSGYRSVHLPFAYHSLRSPSWNGHVIEVQVRTRPQHAWATAVETVGLFTGQELKASVGSPEWLRFFALASSILARSEDTPPVPGTPELYSDLLDEARQLARRLRVRERLEGYRLGLQIAGGDSGAEFFVLVLNPADHRLTLYSYTDPDEAATAYTFLELQASVDTDVVLVGAQDVATLRKAYPNYFGDTSLFVEMLDEAAVWDESE